MLTAPTVFSALVLTLIILIPAPAFTGECYLDAQRPQERLRPPQSAGERPRIFGPHSAPRDVIASTLRTQTQEVRGAPGPQGPVDHDCTHASGYGVRFDDALDGGAAVCRLLPSAVTSARGLENRKSLDK